MDIKEKIVIYESLSYTQKKELKRILKYFDSYSWLVEPSEKLYGVEWTHTDLSLLIK